MQSHPNFKGYDALAGKPNIRIVPSQLAESLGRLTAKDLPTHCPPEFLSSVEAVRIWAIHKGLRFAISPYEWQIAKVFGDGFTVVLWNSRVKKAKSRYINPVFEGVDRSPDAEAALKAIRQMTREH